MVYLISYDLIKPHKDYEGLIKRIKEYGWAKPLESTWLIRTDQDAVDVRAHLKPSLDDNDKLLIIKVTAHWATKNLDPKVIEWMNDHI